MALLENVSTGSPGSQEGAGRRIGIWVLVIFCCAFFAFFPALDHDFVDWDDNGYILDNPFVKSFSPDNLREIFTRPIFFQYQPLTFFSYLLEYTILGNLPFVFHFSNLVWHAVNAVLVFFLVYKLDGRIKIALFCGLLFGLHPLQVESVAWISSRKNLLYGFFFLGSLLSYLFHLDDRGKAFYWGSLLLFLCSCLSKSMAVTLPLLLLALDYQKHGKFSGSVLLEKLPFFLGSFLFFGITMVTHRAAIRPASFFSPADMVFLTCYCFNFYWYKALFPVYLSAIYPLPAGTGLSLGIEYSVAPVFTAIILKLWWRNRDIPGVSAGMTAYLVAVLPALQIVGVGSVIVADRFFYLPAIGILYVFSSLAWHFGRGIGPSSAKGLAAAGLIVALLCFGRTWERCGIWRNTESLFSDVLQTNPRSTEALVNLANLHQRSANYPEATRLIKKVFEITSTDAMAYGLYGLILAGQGRFGEAIENYETALKLHPEDPVTHANIGNLLARNGKPNEARLHLEKAVSINPRSIQARVNLAILLETLGQGKEAEEHARVAMQADPGNSSIRLLLGDLRFRNGSFPEAFEAYFQALEMDPQNPFALGKVAQALVSCPDPRFRDPGRGAALAKSACDLTDYRVPSHLLTYAAALRGMNDPASAEAIEKKAKDILSRQAKPASSTTPQD